MIAEVSEAPEDPFCSGVLLSVFLHLKKIATCLSERWDWGDINTARDTLHLSTGSCLFPNPFVDPYVREKSGLYTVKMFLVSAQFKRIFSWEELFSVDEILFRWLLHLHFAVDLLLAKLEPN